MADEPREERRSGSDRRDDSSSAWRDPRTWMALSGLLLSFLVFVSTQLHDINSGIQALRESDARRGEQIESIKREFSDFRAQANGDIKTATDRVELYRLEVQKLSERLARIEGAK
jgi:hypothetical protein